jgi:hypothetical protein
MFIGNFQDIYERPSTAETLKTINARNAISYIQDIEIINAFCDGVSDIKDYRKDSHEEAQDGG